MLVAAGVVYMGELDLVCAENEQVLGELLPLGDLRSEGLAGS